MFQMIFNFTKKEYYPTKHDKVNNTNFSIKKENQSLNVYITAMFRIVVIKNKEEEFIFNFCDFVGNLLVSNCKSYRKKVHLKKRKSIYKLYLFGNNKPIFNFMKSELKNFLKTNYILFINSIIKQKQFLLYSPDKKKFLNDLIENLSQSISTRICACQLFRILSKTNLDSSSFLFVEKTKKLLNVLVVVFIYKNIVMKFK